MVEAPLRQHRVDAPGESGPFPASCTEIFDNDGARQEVIAEACKVILKEKRRTLRLVTPPILKRRSAT